MGDIANAGDITEDLNKTVGGMVACIFGQVEMKWDESTFPFTEPSIELQIFYQVSVCVCVGVWV